MRVRVASALVWVVVVAAGSLAVVGVDPGGVGAAAGCVSRAYVANFGGGSVSVIDTSTNTVIGLPITVGSNPYGVAITPDGARAYVTNEGGTTVSVIDTSTNTVIGSPITVGSHPHGVAITPDGPRA
jgi:large repetitive protein